MLLTLAVPAFAESFSDVGSSIGAKYRDAINYMSDNGIMVGFEDGTFQPNTVLNRGMAVTILFRMSTDANGNSLSVIDGNISGTMNVYRWTFWPTSPDSPPYYFFVVPRSSSYTCVASDDSLQYFYITNSSGTVGASYLDVVD